MAIAVTKSVSLATLLRLGRVSNLPTVWTNVLAGTVLAGGAWQSWRTGLLLVAMSLFYLGGMYLNDYFDRAIDAHERPERPIPAREVSATAVAAIGFGLLTLGILAMAPMGATGAATGAVLAAVIVAYDAFHKGNPFAPLVMGACRALVYCGAAVAIGGSVPAIVLVAAPALLAYVAGLTYAARQESLDHVGNLWPLVLLAAPLVVVLIVAPHPLTALAICLLLAAALAPAVYWLLRRPAAGSISRAVGWLIAGIAVVDAAFLAAAGALVPAAIAIAGFAATLTAQRYVAGT
jgi:4-hydroxybenzoate polyprenyltransferase